MDSKAVSGFSGDVLVVEDKGHNMNLLLFVPLLIVLGTQFGCALLWCAHALSIPQYSIHFQGVR